MSGGSATRGMGRSSARQVSSVDTAPFIYFAENHPVFSPLVRPLFVSLENGDCAAVTSTVTLLQVLVQPIRNGNLALAQEYREIFQSSAMKMAPVSAEIAAEAARIRAIFGLRTPDAVQLATAVVSQAAVFVTNDTHFSKVRMPGLEILVVESLAKSD
jgi:predicted nucleic acid-binding protein